MASSETARLDLYNALGELIGPENAGTLMTYLPDRKMSDVVAGIEALRSEMTAGFEALRSEMTMGFLAVNGRIDRMFLALVAGLFTIVAAMAAILVAVL